MRQCRALSDCDGGGDAQGRRRRRRRSIKQVRVRAGFHVTGPKRGVPGGVVHIGGLLSEGVMVV